MLQRQKPADKAMNRDAFARSLQTLADEIDQLHKDSINSAMHAAAHSGSMIEFPEFAAILDQDFESGDPRTHDDYLSEVHEANKLMKRLENVRNALIADQSEYERSGHSADPLADHIVALQSRLEELASRVQTQLDGGPPRPLMSVLLAEWTEIRFGLEVDDKKVRTDHNRITDFIEFAGDRPVNKYSFFDFQRWSNLLVRLPHSYSKLPETRNLSREEAADYNDALPSDARLPVLTKKTIETNYISPLNTFFYDVAAEHSFRSPLADAKVKISRYAGKSIQRQPFAVADLNIWFAVAAKESQPDKKWLPVLGVITGARIGELIHLQGKDVTRMEAEDGCAYWVLDLTTDLVGEDGEAQRRKLKNASSRRLIAVHEAFEEIGFIQYAHSRKPDEWLFPGAFYHGKSRVKDVAGAASKRMNAILKDIGIHKPLESVFHSTRHTAKQIMRLAKVDQRTHDMQTGHAFQTVSDGYGAKTLIREEVEILANIPLPSGLDLTPYIQRYQSSLENRQA